jgi:LmbE family N-acetylglucosaminyl deacetylase
MSSPLGVLAIAAHRDDVEQTCGGTLLKMAELGHRTGILDLTRGEMGTRGSAEDRAREAEDAARILKASWRGALDIPDGRVENLAYEACFLAGLAKLDINQALNTSAFSNVAGAIASTIAPSSSASQAAAHRPFKIIYATLYYDIRPTFVVDITDQFEARFESLMAYKTQFSDQEAGRDLFPARAEIRSRVEAMARFYGMLGGVTYAEPFLQKEVGLVEDVTAIPVKSI